MASTANMRRRLSKIERLIKERQCSTQERAIPFSAPMVQAIIDGRKAMTRRVVKPVGDDDGFVLLDHGNGWWPYRSDDGESASHTVKRGGKFYQDETPHKCPYGRSGDTLWVREHWRTYASLDDVPPRAIRSGAGVQYEAGGSNIVGIDRLEGMGKFRPGMFMPRWASRIQLNVTGVRVERLNEISEADAIAEGTAGGHGSIPGYGYSATPIEHYRHLWESLNGSGSWAANPWVWVIEFKRVAP